MKRSTVPSLSRLTLRLPAWGSLPRGWNFNRSHLKLEELEARENPAPVLTRPPFTGLGYPVVIENGSTAHSIDFACTTAFSLSESGSGQPDQYQVNFSVGSGLLSFDSDAATAEGLTWNANSTSIQLIGSSGDLNDFFVYSGITYTPRTYFSGTVALSYSASNYQTSEQGTVGTMAIYVSPVADPPTVGAMNLTGTFVNNGDGTYTTPEFALPLTYILADDDGSESIAYVEIEPPFSYYGDSFAYDDVYGSNVEVTGEGRIRIYAPALADFRFYATSDYLATGSDYYFYAFTKDTAVDPAAVTHNVLSEETSGGFSVTYLPTVDLADPTGTFTENSPSSSNAIPISAILDDPTNTSSSGYELTLTGNGGVFTAGSSGVVYHSGEGTGTLTLSAYYLYQIQEYLDSASVTFVPTDYFSGNITISAHLAEDNEEEGPPSFASLAEDGTDSFTVFVEAIASPLTIEVDYPSTSSHGSGSVDLNYVFSVGSWPDNDDSEYVTFAYELNGINQFGQPMTRSDFSTFSLTSDNGALTFQYFPNTWSTGLTFTDWSEVQSILDSLHLTTPEDFRGQVTLSIVMFLYDTPKASGESVFSSAFDSFTINFVAPPSVTLPTHSGNEGQSIDLGGGKYVATHAAAQADGLFELDFEVPGGSFRLNPDLVTSVGEGVWTTASGLTIYSYSYSGMIGIALEGTLDQINGFLAQSGSLFYDPADSQWAGRVPVDVWLYSVEYYEGEGSDYEYLFNGSSDITLTPVPTNLTPVTENVSTIPGETVYLPVTVPSSTDTSETVTIYVHGVPAGGYLNVGEDLGGGTWQIPSYYVPYLYFTPPAGAAGSYTFTIEVVVTDTGEEFEYEGGGESSFVALESLGESTVPPVTSSFTSNLTVTVSPFTMDIPVLRGAEGQPVDLGGGKFAVSNPAVPYYYYFEITFSVPGGTLGYNDAYLGEGGPKVYVNRDGSITIRGRLDSINDFLAQAGSLTYQPISSQWAGVVPIRVVFDFDNSEGGEGCGCGFNSFEQSYAPLVDQTFNLVLAPTADSVLPTLGNVQTPQDSPVGINIRIPNPPTDPSEVVTIYVSGLPAGATLNHGTNLGGGRWSLSIKDLPGLIFIPPPGTAGAFTLTVQVVVTDFGDELPVEEPVPSFASFSTFLVSAKEGESNLVSPVSTTTSSTLIVTVTAPTIVVSPPATVPPPPPDSLPPETEDTTDYGTGTTSFVVETLSSTATITTTSTTTTTADTIATSNAAAFGMIPGPEVSFETASESEPEVPSMPSLGSPPAAATSATASFAAGREKHPLQPIQALEHDSATTLFEGSGDSIPLVEELYRGAVPTPPEMDPKSSGEPNSSAAPYHGPLTSPRQAPAIVGTAIAGSPEIQAGDERIASEVRTDSDATPESKSNLQTGLMFGLLPLLSTLLMTDGRQPKPIVRRWLRHLLFKPRTREGVS